MAKFETNRIRALLFLTLLASGFMGLSALAQSDSGSKGATGANTKYEFHMSAGFIGLSNSSTQYDLAPGLDFKPLPGWNWLQLGGEITYQKIAFRGGDTSNLEVMLGPTANFGSGTGDSFFLAFGLAIKAGSTDIPDTSTENPNGVGFYFIVGKRFPIGGNFSLRPSLGVVSTGTTGMVFRPFAISYFY